MKGGEGIRLTNVLSQEAGRRDVGGGDLESHADRLLSVWAHWKVWRENVTSFWPLKCNNIVYAVVEFRLLTVPQRRVASLEINSLNARGIRNNEVHF